MGGWNSGGSRKNPKATTATPGLQGGRLGKLFLLVKLAVSFSFLAQENQTRFPGKVERKREKEKESVYFIVSEHLPAFKALGANDLSSCCRGEAFKPKLSL